MEKLNTEDGQLFIKVGSYFLNTFVLVWYTDGLASCY